MSIQNTVTFTTKEIVGDVSGRKFESGFFECKTKLSIKEGLREGEMVRRLLGTGSQEAPNDERYIAKAIAYLAFRIVKSPQWWKDCGGGQDLDDINVLAHVNNSAMEAVAAEYEKLNVEAEKAQPVLKDQLQG